ncbi:MAG: hypothetical protein WA364_20465 [Candidatus Nitrosopolaris sp.]
MKLRLQSEESSRICTRMEGFSLYENTVQNVSIQYPSNWNKQEILLNNDHRVLQVMFALPIAARFSKAEDSETMSEKIRDIMYNQSSTVVVLSLKKLPLHETSTLQAITNDHIQTLRICFDNVNLLETSYDYNMAEIPASKIIYTYTDPLQNQSNKQGMQIISVKSHREITITYNSQIQDFQKFLSTVNKMINTFSIEL